MNTLGASMPSRIPALDGLRGVAVLLVLLFHTLTPPFVGGFVGVDIFFVLSGYLICALLLREWQKTGRVSLARFYMRRFLRLMPTLWALLAVVLVLLFWRYDHDTFLKARREALWALCYVSNWVRALGKGGEMNFFAHTWSLGIEEQFYLFWPAVLYFCVTRGGARRTLQVALALAFGCWLWRCVLLAYGAVAERLYNGLDTRLDAPMWGCALAAWLHGRRTFFSAAVQRMLCYAALVAVLALMLLACHVDWQAAYFHQWGGVVVSWLAALLILDAEHNPRSFMAPLLRWRPLVFLGTISYSLYIWHWSFEMFLVQHGMDIPQIRLYTWLFVPPLAWLSFVFVERPFLRLKARFAPEC